MFIDYWYVDPIWRGYFFKKLYFSDIQKINYKPIYSLKDQYCVYEIYKMLALSELQ